MNAYNEPRLAIYYILDISTAVVLNVLMIVAGAGLHGPEGMGPAAGDLGRPAQDPALGRDGRRFHGL